MGEEKKYRNYTAADIEKYHKGLLTPKEMNELEKAALDDPFLADALEGYITSANVAADLSELQGRLNERTRRGKIIAFAAPPGSSRWWKVAAAVVIIGGVVFFAYRLSTGDREKKIAVSETKPKENGRASVGIIDSGGSKPQPTAPTVDSNRQSTAITAGEAKKNSGAAVVKKRTDTIGDVAATELTPMSSAPVAGRTDREDSSTNVAAITSRPEAFAKTRAAEQNARQAEAPTIVQRKQSVAQDEQTLNYFGGKVIDKNHDPVPFANITNTKDNVGTYADAKGNFTLISRDTTLEVQVRSVGFESNQARLKNNVSTNQVIMEEEKVSPNEVLRARKQDTTRYHKAFVNAEEPEPADGWDNYSVYLANNINPPDDLKKKEFDSNQVHLSFDVNQFGDPVNIKVERSLCQKCDEEAIRAVKEGPKWKKKNKKINRVTIAVPFDVRH